MYMCWVNEKFYRTLFSSNMEYIGQAGWHIQGWISDMGIDGPTFVPKGGYFLLIWVKVCPQKLAFS